MKYEHELSLGEFKKKYGRGDMFCVKDGRILVYLGVNAEGYYMFLYIDNIMCVDGYNDEYTEYVREYLNKEVVLSRVPDSIAYLRNHCKVKHILLDYKTIPCIVDFMGKVDESIIEGVLNPMCKAQGITEVKKKEGRSTLQLKRGYLYEKINKTYSEVYMYIGRYNMHINSYYMADGDKKNARLFMFVCSNFYKNDSEELKNQSDYNSFSSRKRSGYDGNFSINFPLKSLKELGKGNCPVEYLPSEDEYLVI